MEALYEGHLDSCATVYKFHLFSVRQAHLTEERNRLNTDSVKGIVLWNFCVTLYETDLTYITEKYSGVHEPKILIFLDYI